MPAQTNTSSLKKIGFSGYTWFISHSDQPAAPGPNFWSNENAWLDKEGKLHLKLSKNITTGLWHCAELFTMQKLGFGTYTLTVEGSIDQLDRNVVFGIFSYSGIDQHDEIDIECSRWGRSTGNNLHYSVWPRKNIEAKKWSAATNFNLEGTYTTHRIIRSASSVTFQNMHGFGNDRSQIIFEASCNRKNFISEAPMPLYLNLWLFNGKAPSDGKEVEIIIHSFSFTARD